VISDRQADRPGDLGDSPPNPAESEDSDAHFVHLRVAADFAPNLLPGRLIDGFRQKDPGPNRVAQQRRNVFDDGLSIGVRRVHHFDAASSAGGHVDVVDANAGPGDDL